MGFKRDDGWIEISSGLILIFVGAMVFGLGIIFAGNAAYFRKNKNEYELKKESDEQLMKIIYDIQGLKNEKYDSPYNPFIEYMIGKYSKNNLSMEDVSSGFHLDFLSDSDLLDSRLSVYIFKSGSASQFIRERNNKGLTANKEDFKPYVNEKAYPSCTSYGWINGSFESTFAFKEVVKTFKTNDYKKLFPLVNSFALMNVNYVNPEILEPFIMRDSFKITQAKEKYQTLKAKIEQGSAVDDSDLVQLLFVPLSNKIFAYIGGKTAFWKLTFSANSQYITEAIVAAIPQEDGDPRKVEKYTLIDRRFISVKDK